MKNPRFMMMLLACTALLSLTQCSSDEPSPVAKPADVYVAGNFNTLAGEGGYNWIPVYWKNGEMVTLTEDKGDAELIVVKDGDVYVFGDLDDGTKIKRMWKNGDMTNFTNGDHYTSLNNVKFIGDDLYVVGTVNSHATYWKNGNIHTINTEKSSGGYDIAVAGDTVYVVGYEYNADGLELARIWKNDEGTFLADKQSRGYGVATLNGDVYVSGYKDESNNTPTLVMWKNCDLTPPIGTPGNSGTGTGNIAIHDQDVYITGYEGKEAKIWKNGTSTTLPKPPGVIETYSYFTAFDGDNVFLLGEGTKDAFSYSVLVWKNNELVAPYDGTVEFSAYAMCVARPN